MSSCLVNTARLTTNANRQLLIAFVIKRFNMKRPKQITVTIEWTDDKDEQHTVVYENEDAENAEIHLGLLNGTICESDLEP